MQTDNPNSETLDNNNISKMSFSSHKEKKKKRNKVFWSEREEKTLFILQMVLFQVISLIMKLSLVKNIFQLLFFYFKILLMALLVEVLLIKIIFVIIGLGFL